MEGLKNMLLEEQKHLNTIIHKIQRSMHEAPDGKLKVSVDKDHIRYYYCTETKKTATYIRKDNWELARGLAQKEYDEKVLKLARKRVSQINRILTDYEDQEIENCYYKEHYARHNLIQPVEVLWEERLKNWLEESYEGKPFYENTKEIYTQRGERVRSKSEKILADYFYYHGIVYKYECPLVLKGVGKVYPDFTFLSKRTGQEIYWEHDGMMDQSEYARAAIKKIAAYEKNGIFPGERLILTFETEQTVLSSELIEELVERYLLDKTRPNG